MMAKGEEKAKSIIAKVMNGLEPDQRERVLSRVADRYDMRGVLDSLNTEIRHEKAGVIAELAPLNERIEALKRIKPWAEMGNWQLERNTDSRLHKLIEAHAAGKVINEDREPLPAEHAPWLLSAQPFVVEHDWAAAFANATDYAEGEFKLPYQECAFEFRISGKTVIVISFQPDADVLHQFDNIKTSTPSLPYVDCGNGYWYCGGQRAQTEQSMAFIWNQIRAISIALDAEVATREVVRAPIKLNEKRIRDGKVPLFDYHVVRIHGRAKRPMLPGVGGSHRSPRLHFRRGHWRHYATHKTWIKWMLVGDPQLGFIDKAYRL